MKPQVISFHKFTAAALVALALFPASLFAESRPQRQTAAQIIEAIQQQHNVRKSSRRPAPARQQQQTRSSSRISANAILDEMNLHRRRYGLTPLALNDRLSLAATDRVNDMFDQRYFDHVSPDGTQPFVWANHRGYRYSTIGENLAEGQRSASDVVNGWMNSPGHRANILGKSFEDCGLAIAQGSPTGRTNGFTFVALYAREARSRARA